MAADISGAADGALVLVTLGRPYAEVLAARTEVPGSGEIGATYVWAVALCS